MDMLKSFLRDAPLWVFLFMFGVPALLACIGIGVALWTWRIARSFKSLPANKISELEEGYRLAQGRVASDTKITAPLTGRSCAWYEVKVEESVRSQTASSSSGDRDVDYTWRTVRHDSSRKPLRIVEGDAQCYVYPEDATVFATDWSEWYGSAKKPEERNPDKYPGHLTPGGSGRFESFGNDTKRFRYLERYICPGDPVFAMGMVSPGKTGTGSADFAIKSPHDRRPFIISTRSPGEIHSESQMAVQGGLIMAGTMAALAAFVWTLKFP